MRLFLTTISAVAVLAASLTVAAAGERSSSRHPKSDEYRGQTEVRGFAQSIGGYSYEFNDGQIDARDKSVFLDPDLTERDDVVTFDNGFFYDSSAGDSGVINDTPYPN
ncbi:MAG: hypothetical protein AAGF32_08055 [Pseudomonadota bacterium]